MPNCIKKTDTKLFCRRRKAFTLAETLVAVALLGTLLAVLATLAFQLMGYWAAQTEDPLFDRHVDGLRRTLEECIAETTESENTRGTPRTAANVFKATPDGGELPYLRITGSPEFLLSDTRPLGNIDAWLEFRQGTGLVMRWRTDAEKRDSPAGVHEFTLSPWVAAISFSAYDGENNAWTELGESPKAGDVTGNSSIFMKLTLNHRGQIREISLPIADAAPHNLNY